MRVDHTAAKMGADLHIWTMRSLMRRCSCDSPAFDLLKTAASARTATATCWHTSLCFNSGMEHTRERMRPSSASTSTAGAATTCSTKRTLLA